MSHKRTQVSKVAMQRKVLREICLTNGLYQSRSGYVEESFEGDLSHKRTQVSKVAMQRKVLREICLTNGLYQNGIQYTSCKWTQVSKVTMQRKVFEGDLSHKMTQVSKVAMQRKVLREICLTNGLKLVKQLCRGKF